MTAAPSRDAEPPFRSHSGRSRAYRVGLIGTYGHGNLGDEAVFVSFLQWVAANAPQVVPVALCVNPEYIEQNYGVPAYAVAPRYAGTGAGQRSAGGERRSTPSDPRRPHANLLRAIRRSIDRLRDAATRALPGLMPVLRPPWRLLKGFLTVARFLPRQVRIARSLDGVIVLGGGQIHDFWDGPFGHPVALWSWALASRMAGRPFGILSIGAVDLLHGMSRRFIRAMFGLSVYATVRDRGSAACVAALGLPRACPICPDLAWGLRPMRLIDRPEKSQQPHEAPNRDSSPRTIGVSPIAYRHPQLWARIDANADDYARYIGKVAGFCNRLLNQGYDVVLFPTQIRMDVTAVKDVLEGISPELVHRVHPWRVDGVPELAKCLASVDVVVASRFHGVLLSLCSGRPVLSLAYQPKCNALLEELGEGQFGLDIHDSSEDEIWERFERLQGHFGAYAARLQPHIEENRRRLDAQYQSYLAKLS